MLSGYRPSTGNLTILGDLDRSHSIAKGFFNPNTFQVTWSYYYPLVPAGWTADQPVQWILKTKRYLGQPAEELPTGNQIAATHRNILWEGLPTSVRTDFTSKHQIKVLEGTQLVEFKSKFSISDRTYFWIAIGVTGFCCLVTVLSMWLVLSE